MPHTYLFIIIYMYVFTIIKLQQVVAKHNKKCIEINISFSLHRKIKGSKHCGCGQQKANSIIYVYNKRINVGSKMSQNN